MKKISSLFACLLIFTALKSQSTFTICSGNSASLQATNPLNVSNANYSIQPGGVSNLSGSFIVTPSLTTTYTLFTTGLNASNVLVSNSLVTTVLVNSQPSSVPNVTQATCTNSLSGFNLNLNFTPSVPMYTIYWSQIPNGIFTAQQVSVSSQMTPGAYTATITAFGGCSVTSNFTINQQPEPVNFQLLPAGNSFTLNCYQPNLTTSVSPASNSYSWTNSLSALITGTSAVITPSTLGNWTLTAVNPVSGCSTTQIFSTFQNFTAPSSSLSSTLMNISCSSSFVPTFTLSGTPTLNVQHNVLSPFGGTYSANSYSTIYVPGGPGTFTNCFINKLNGCSTCKTFTITSNTGFPTFSVVSPQSFTLGCNSKSVAVVQIVNGSGTNSLQIPTAGAVSYSILSPSSTFTLAGLLSPLNTYTLASPGTYTVVVRDNVSLCDNKTSISIISNTIAPTISARVPRQILNCDVNSTVLEGYSQTPNVNFEWTFMGVPGISPGSSLAVAADLSAVTQSLVNNFTLTVEDQGNACKSLSVVPIYQNLFPPKAKISSGTNSVITCMSPTLVLTNQSLSGIPSNSIFQNIWPVLGYTWFGPPPIDLLQLSSTYIVGAAGTYTLEAKDLNNGCKSQTTIVIGDSRVYPQITLPGSYFVECPGTVTLSAMLGGMGAGYSYSWTAPFNATTSILTTPNLITSSAGYYYLIVTNTITGCSSTASTVVQACVGLASNENNIYTIKVFPNPGSGKFTINSINLPGHSKLEIYNSVGQLIKTVIIESDQIELNLENESKGLYFLKVKNESKLLSTQKIILH